MIKSLGPDQEQTDLFSCVEGEDIPLARGRLKNDKYPLRRQPFLEANFKDSMVFYHLNSSLTDQIGNEV